MDILNKLLQDDEEVSKLLRLRRAIDRALAKKGVGGKKKKRAGRKDEGEVNDFFDLTADNSSVHDNSAVHDEEGV